MNLLFAQETPEQSPVVTTPALAANNADNTQTSTVQPAPGSSQLPPDAKQPPPSGGGMEFLLIMLPPILLFYWFFMLRPQQKQQDQQRKMLDGLDKNDRILTVGGIIGTIHNVDKEKNEIVVKVDDSNNTKIRFALGAVQMVFPKDEEKAKEK